MDELQSLYQESNKLSYDIDGKINEIYVGFKDKSEMDDIVYLISEKISVFERQVFRLRNEFGSLVSNNQFQGGNQSYWDKKLQRLEKSLKLLPSTLEKAVKNQTRSMEQTKLRTNIERRNRNEEELKLQSENIKASLEYTESIRNQGESILENLSSQTEVLKKVKLRTFQFLNVLGVSGSIMRLIERRGREDNLIVIALCLVTLLVMYLTYYYIKPLFSFS